MEGVQVRRGVDALFTSFHAKEQVERVSEEDTIEGLAHHVASLLKTNPI